MLYISLSDNSIELIQTKKRLFGSEVVVSSARKILKDGIVEKGTIVNETALLAELIETFKSAYPTIVSDKEAAFVIPDENVHVLRFHLSLSKGTDISGSIINYVRTNHNLEPEKMENYFRLIPKTYPENEILYTAIKKETAVGILKFSRLSGLECRFITCRAFAQYELIKSFPDASNPTLFLNLEQHNISYSLFDQFGPLELGHNKVSTPSFVKDISKIIDKVGKGSEESIQIMLCGTSVKEINIEDLSANLKRPIKSVETYLVGLLENKKMKFDTGGIPVSTYCYPLGLLLHSRNPAPVNFSRDITEKIEASNVSQSDQKEIGRGAEVLQSIQEKKSIGTEILQSSSDKKSTVTEELQTSSDKKNTVGEELQTSHIKKVDEQKTDQFVNDIKIGESKVIEKPSEKNAENSIKTEIYDNPTNDKILLGSSIEEYKKTGITQIFTNKITLIIVGIIIIGIVILISLGIVSGKGVSGLPFISNPTVTPSQTPVPTLTPTPTIDASLRRSDLKLSIQNGTDKAGFAKETADGLEKKGYTGVAKSNADKDTYEKTIIKIKEAKKNYLPLIISDLADKFDTSTVETLESESKFDAVIILGKI